MSMLVRTIVAVPLLVFFTLVSWLGWTFLDPFAAAIDNATTDPLGMVDAVYLLMSLSFRFVIPGLAVVVIGWWLFGAIRTDARFRTRRRP